MSTGPFDDIQQKEFPLSESADFQGNKSSESDVNNLKTKQQGDAVMLTIKASFICATLITVFRFLLTRTDDASQFAGDISTIWNIFIPVITLAIGYMFGKSDSSKT